MSGLSAKNICTDRLILEPLKVFHAKFMFGGLRNDAAYVYLPENPPETLQEVENRYEKLEIGRSPDGKEIWLNWAIRMNDEVKYVGYVQSTILPDREPALIAYHVFPEYWGRGFGLEATGAVLRELQSSYPNKEIRAHIDTRNRKSIRLIEKLGFRLQSQIAGADFFRGEISDEFVYTLISN